MSISSHLFRQPFQFLAESFSLGLVAVPDCPLQKKVGAFDFLNEVVSLRKRHRHSTFTASSGERRVVCIPAGFASGAA